MKNKLWFLTKYSLDKKIKSKWFIIANVLLLVLIASLTNIDKIISSFGGNFNQAAIVEVIDETNKAYPMFEGEMNKQKKQLGMISKYEVKKFTGNEKEEAHVSVFVAAGTRRVQGVRSKVQENYAAVAQGNSSCSSQPAPVDEASSSSCCSSSSSCCSSTSEIIPLSDLEAAPVYTPTEMQQAPSEAAEFSLGCGNPTALAGLKPGETVLDIGSGGGLDAFLSAARVGPSGKVIGVDMTPEMIARARRAAEKGGYTQVEFRLGQAEELPVEDQTIDVVISNCVINLCEDKGKVFREAGRVLESGGRLEISDMVTDEPLPLSFSDEPGNWSGCVYGALTEREYVDLIKQAGFQDLQLRRSQAALVAPGVRIYSLNVSAKRS
jgi:SAM-dependent methyltransferase